MACARAGGGARDVCRQLLFLGGYGSPLPEELSPGHGDGNSYESAGNLSLARPHESQNQQRIHPMKLAWHIVTKDFRRFWLGALLLAGLVGLKLFLLDGVFHSAITGEWGRGMRNYQSMLLIAQLIFSFFLAVATV